MTTSNNMNFCELLVIRIQDIVANNRKLPVSERPIRLAIEADWAIYAKQRRRSSRFVFITALFKWFYTVIEHFDMIYT
jgi:hypothetical protein